MSRSRTRTHLALLALPLAALALAACSSDSAASPNTTTDTTADTTAATDAATVQLADNSLGTILVDGSGNSLYLFANDTPTTPACDAGCLSNWPPLLADGTPILGAGLSAEDFGTVTATDGSLQVTFYGHPLYHFAGDTAAGEASGQGIGGVWFVVDGDGNAVK